jgi:hypothetical protein
MLQIHRLRRASEDSKQFYPVPPRLNSPRLPENTLLPVQTIRSALINLLISEYLQILMLRRVKCSKMLVSSAQFLGSFDEDTLRLSSTANRVDDDQQGLSPKIGDTGPCVRWAIAQFKTLVYLFSL